jgi:DNA modification methylase
MDLHLGDCLEILPTLPDNSVDSIVTDPPYGLGFMGKHWDHGVPGVDFWIEMLRVVKPGGHLLAFGGSRTYHRMATAIEDAGWEIRDCIMWLYGSGFPKSHNGTWGGTALKPAHEPIVMARKPLIGTVASNVLVHGTGGLNIDACRVGTDGGTSKEGMPVGAVSMNAYGDGLNTAQFGQTVPGLGRWPANVIHDGSDEVLESFPEVKGAIGMTQHGSGTNAVYGKFGRTSKSVGGEGTRDSGSAARFFYAAKASKHDREEGLESVERAQVGDGPAVAADNAYQRGATLRSNTHPTVKPTDLMRYLCRLVTPSGGMVLDPFMGSGSTGKAAVLEGFQFTGIERELEYWCIAYSRIDKASNGG